MLHIGLVKSDQNLKEKGRETGLAAVVGDGDEQGIVHRASAQRLPRDQRPVRVAAALAARGIGGQPHVRCKQAASNPESRGRCRTAAAFTFTAG